MSDDRRGRLSPRTLASARGAVVAARGAVVAAVALSLLPVLRPPSRWTVVGDSMAPTLLGAHHRLSCPDCGFEFAVSATSPADAAVCPNCGQRGLPLGTASVEGGDQVAVRPAAPATLRRLDLAAYRQADGKALVKRVWGLPGESLAVRQGDLWIDGQPLRKTLPQQRQVAVLVHDSRFESGMLGRRWHAEPSASWRPLAGGGWRLSGSGRLVYRHRVNYPGRLPRTAASLVYDQYAYNVALSRTLNVVHDLLLDCRLRIRGSGRLRVVLADGPLAAHWDLSRNELTAGGARAQAASPSGWFTLTCGRFDGQWVVAVDGRTLVRQAGATTAGATVAGATTAGATVAGATTAGATTAGASPQPWRLEAERLEVEVSRLQVWRDLHFYCPHGRPSSWRLGPEQWLLLGDNIPASWDSRQAGPVGGDWLLGKVAP